MYILVHMDGGGGSTNGWPISGALGGIGWLTRRV